MYDVRVTAKGEHNGPNSQRRFVQPWFETRGNAS